MHIPDGYLGPITCIVMYCVMIPLWIYGGYKIKKEMNYKQVPLLAVGAAFSFILMMFNVPVTFGTTAHAVGGALIAIVLGPWPALIAVSVALLIQLSSLEMVGLLHMVLIASIWVLFSLLLDIIYIN